MTTPPDIEFAHVTRRIGEQTLLDDINLTVPRGQKVALIGASGAGKSTMLRLLSGIAWPTTGSLRVLDQPIGQLHGRALQQLRRQIGFLHQNDNLVPQLRVAHNVLMARLGDWPLWRSLWSLLRPQQLELAHDALARVELADRLWALPDELSGGEQQRVAIARLLLQQPRLVLADEPVSALDVRLGREVLKQLFELVADNRTLVVSLHSLVLLDRGFDRVIALRAGKVVYDGTPEHLDSPLLRDIYGAELDLIEISRSEISNIGKLNSGEPSEGPSSSGSASSGSPSLGES